LIIHPAYQPFHLNATHSNISFGISLRNLANKESSSDKSSTSEIHPSFSEGSTLVVQPLNVALPSEATIVSQTSNEHSTEPDCMITLQSSDDRDEQPNQWFRPGFLNQTLSSSSPFVLEYVHDQPLEPTNQIVVTEITSKDVPSSSNQLCSPIQTTIVSSPPTLLLDSIILKEVCENIFKDLNKLVKSRRNLIHNQDYVNK